MTTPITIESIELQGFRAYLKTQSFTLCDGNKPKSLAIFAPNAKGKSSLVDAFEYYFSKDATLQRLGLRASQTQTGPAALEHVEAGEYGITPAVSFKFRQGANKLGDVRDIASGKALPHSAQLVLSATRVPFIIHGYELRGFVEASSETRYREIASWFSLDPLLAIQNNLRALQRQVKAKADSQIAGDERLRDLQRMTSDGISIWNESAICDWFNTQILSRLDESLTLSEISESDTVYLVLAQRREEEEKRVGVAALKTLIAQIDALSMPVADSEEQKSGLVPDFERSFSDFGLAADGESKERGRASQSVFNEMWSKAQSLFEMDDHDFDFCPVCDTEFGATPHGSRDAVRISINAKLAMLTSYRQAEATLATAIQQLSKHQQSLRTTLENLCNGLASADYEAAAGPVTDYLAELESWDHAIPLPDSRDLIQAFDSIRRFLIDARGRLEEQQGENTYAHAYNIANQLIQVRTDLTRIYRSKEELQKLHSELVKQANLIESAINRHNEGLLSELEHDVDVLYKKIQGVRQDEPTLIRLQLAAGSAANQQQVRLVVDYGKNRKDVAPSGYLSDSQIHTAALSLRLAAIRKFNTGAPIMVLDDVVTSYDADHRKTIASALAEEFEGMQIVLVTHDEQFFYLLQDHLPAATWVFRRITHIEPSFGPVFSDYRTPDEVIQRKLDDGEPVGEEIRKSQEEWLLTICRDFGVEVVIRPMDKPYQYERSELATALAGFLKARNLVPPKVPGISNPFLNSLQRDVVENFASHFSDNPYRSASSGDERARWQEWRLFRDSFVCSNCGRNRFRRPREISKPVCRKCETPFEFSVT